MKQITMDWETYQAEIEYAKRSSHIEGFDQCIHVLRYILQNLEHVTISQVIQEFDIKDNHDIGIFTKVIKILKNDHKRETNENT